MYNRDRVNNYLKHNLLTNDLDNYFDDDNFVLTVDIFRSWWARIIGEPNVFTSHFLKKYVSDTADYSMKKTSNPVEISDYIWGDNVFYDRMVYLKMFDTRTDAGVKLARSKFVFNLFKIHPTKIHTDNVLYDFNYVRLLFMEIKFNIDNLYLFPKQMKLDILNTTRESLCDRYNTSVDILKLNKNNDSSILYLDYPNYAERVVRVNKFTYMYNKKSLLDIGMDYIDNILHTLKVSQYDIAYDKNINYISDLKYAVTNITPNYGYGLDSRYYVQTDTNKKIYEDKKGIMGSDYLLEPYVLYDKLPEKINSVMEVIKNENDN